MLFYKHQSKVEALSRKTGNASYRISDQASILYGGRGKPTGGDETVYLNNKNNDAPGVNRFDADAWQTFAAQHGVTGTTRADQSEREFYQEGNYP